MVYKENVGDYPLLDCPCEHWWVRYGTGCTFLTDAQEKLWGPKITALLAKYNVSHYSYSGNWKSLFCGLHKVTLKDVKEKERRKLWVCSIKTKKDIEVTNKSSELWKTLELFIEGHLDWVDCPYQMEHQSVCPFYEKNKFYASQPLEELRKRKGYET